MTKLHAVQAIDEARERPAAHVIRSDEEALDVARRLAVAFEQEAAERDSARKLPFAEVQAFAQSGLWAIGIPKDYGGAGVSYVTLAEVVAIISAADPSIGQIPQSNYMILDALHRIGTPAQRELFSAEALSGKTIGNAFAEIGGKTVLEVRSRLSRTSRGLRLNARKAYATGSLFADWVPISGLNDDDQIVYAYIPRDAPGLKILDDWDGIGQRTTASGTVVAEDVEVDPAHVIERYKFYDKPGLGGPLGQLLHTAIDVGIARASLGEAVKLAKSAKRPWIDSGVERAQEDPHTIAQLGELQIRVHTADAMLERAARVLERNRHDPTPDEVAETSVAVAEAKVVANGAALFAASKLFEFGGAGSAVASRNLDRHWRNARTHTLHDPVRWKYHLIGDHLLNDRRPPVHVYA